MLKIVQLIRFLFLNTVIIVDDFDNYYIYGRDVYVVYYLLKLSIKHYNREKFIKNDINYLNFLIDKLNKNYINYVVLVKRWGYDVEKSENFSNNNYQNYYLKGKIVYKRNKDIDKIVFRLKFDILNNQDKKKKIKEVINECI